MSRPIQDVRVWSIQDRRVRPGVTKPWVVRWSVDNRQRSRAYRTKAEADHHRSRLLVALRDGERFDPVTTEPTSWGTVSGDVQLYDWTRRWLAEQWPEWQPRTRTAAVEALARFVPLVRTDRAPAPPADTRRHLVRSLPPVAAIDPDDPVERWLRRWSTPLSDLDRETMAVVERQLVTGVSGQPLAASVASRYRKVSHACVRRAVELEIIDADPWPPASGGRSRRKANRLRRPIDVRSLPGPEPMAAAISAIRTHQPGSWKYEVMTAVAYYAGLRPSEVVMLRSRALHLPPDGWGSIDVVEADIGKGESGDPKTGPRTVPIPPILVRRLDEWVDGLKPDAADLIFRTRNGKRPAHSNWSRAWRRALDATGQSPLRVYDCRHAAATTWLRAGVPLGEIAQRMGHTVETLVSTYVHALQGDDAVANARIDAVLAGP